MHTPLHLYIRPERFHAIVTAFLIPLFASCASSEVRVAPRETYDEFTGKREVTAILDWTWQDEYSDLRHKGRNLKQNVKRFYLFLNAEHPSRRITLSLKEDWFSRWHGASGQHGDRIYSWCGSRGSRQPEKPVEILVDGRPFMPQEIIPYRTDLFSGGPGDLIIGATAEAMTELTDSGRRKILHATSIKLRWCNSLTVEATPNQIKQIHAFTRRVQELGISL